MPGNSTRGGGGGKDLPPLREAIHKQEGYGSHSSDRYAEDRAVNKLPKPNSTNRKGKKDEFHNSFYGPAAAEVLEPRASASGSSPGKYSSSTSGYDKIAKDKKKSSGSGSHH